MTGWRYSINYGPEGEENYAMVYDAEGDLVGNLRTHHAMALIAAANASNSAALEANDRALAEADAEIERLGWENGRLAIESDRMEVGLNVAERQRDEALEALRAGWQPIETAPKDGTTVLLWGPYCSHPSVCEFHRWQWFLMADGYRAIEHMSDFGTEYHTFQVPTHWMPLPRPPESSCRNLADANQSKSPSSQDQEIAGLRAALEKIAAIEDEATGGDWDEIEKARQIARSALSPLDGEA